MFTENGFLIPCAVGVILDLLFGDPRRMPHITRFVGGLSVLGEKCVVALLGRTVFAGLILWILITSLVIGLYLALAHYLMQWSPWLKVSLDSIIVFQVIAFRDLVKHVRDVKTALGQSIEAARKKVSWIVGRDTDQMDESDVCRAAIESGAENLNDAVIAPIFWLVLTGPIGALIYRIANTLDAMVGHRTERFEKVGKISARLDDLLNLIPARLCALLILPTKKIASWRALKKDAAKHPSINAGWPEATMSRRLGVVIGGRMYEGGKLVQTAEMNEGARQPGPLDIEKCTQVMGITYSKLLMISLLAGIIVYYYRH